MKFKLLLKCFTSAALAAAVMFPATSSATISGSKPLVQYSKLKAVFNEGAASAAHSLEIGKAETIYAYDVARSKLTMNSTRSRHCCSMLRILSRSSTVCLI